MCIGPFNAHAYRDDMLAAVFPPENDIDLSKTYAVSVKAHNGSDVSRVARWRKVSARNGFLNFAAEYTRHHGGGGNFIINDVTYAFTKLRSPRDQKAILIVGHDDPIKVKLNGEEVARLTGQPFFKTERINVSLRAGLNTIHIKNSNTQHPVLYCWDGFSLFVEDAQGRRMDSFSLDLSP